MVRAILSLYGCASRKSSSSLTALLMYTADQQNVKQISDHLPGSHLGAEKQQDHRKRFSLFLLPGWIMTCVLYWIGKLIHIK